MVDVTIEELKLYMELDKKINIRAAEIAKQFNLSGGDFDSVYISDNEFVPEGKEDTIIIEMGEMSHGEYIPTTHYLTPEEFCLPNGNDLYETRVKKEYEEWKNKCENNNSKRRIFKLYVGD